MSSTADMEMRLKAQMLAALDGDGRAYRGLLEELRTHLRRYYARRLGSALAANCDDLVQDTLMAIHTRRVTYDRDQPLTGWVYAIARYKLIDHFRRYKLRATVPLEGDAGIFAVDDAGDAAARMDVQAALGTLPARAADLIRQVRLDGASIAEAAATSGMSESAVKVSIHRGLKALTARFSRGGADER
jgi:RNA polymerase sigma factor (sigma-70 family)